MALRLLLGNVERPFFNFAQLIPKGLSRQKQYSTSVAGESEEREEIVEYEPENEHFNRYLPFCINEVRLLGQVGINIKQYRSDKASYTVFSLGTLSHYISETGETSTFSTWHKVLVRQTYLQNNPHIKVQRGLKLYIVGFLCNRRLIPDDSDERSQNAVTYVYANKINMMRTELRNPHFEKD